MVALFRFVLHPQTTRKRFCSVYKIKGSVFLLRNNYISLDALSVVRTHVCMVSVVPAWDFTSVENWLSSREAASGFSQQKGRDLPFLLRCKFFSMKKMHENVCSSAYVMAGMS